MTLTSIYLTWGWEDNKIIQMKGLEQGLEHYLTVLPHRSRCAITEAVWGKKPRKCEWGRRFSITGLWWCGLIVKAFWEEGRPEERVGTKNNQVSFRYIINIKLVWTFIWQNKVLMVCKQKNLTLEMIYRHFCHTLLVTETNLDTIWEGITQGCANQWVEIIEGASWNLASTVVEDKLSSERRHSSVAPGAACTAGSLFSRYGGGRSQNMSDL